MDRRSLVIALPAQTPRPPGAGTAANRDDFWSDADTLALINAWGERHLLLNHKQWQEVADTVAAANAYANPPKTPSQCQNRIDALKRRYKAERSKTTPSSWPFFRRLHRLIAHPPPLSQFSHPEITNMQKLRSLQEHPAVTRKRSGMQELAEAIVQFGETYERVETTKLKQTLEMEKHRAELALEIEVQRMRFFMETQLELSQNKRSKRMGTSDVTCKSKSNRSTNNRGKWQSWK